MYLTRQLLSVYQPWLNHATGDLIRSFQMATLIFSAYFGCRYPNNTTLSILLKKEQKYI